MNFDSLVRAYSGEGWPEVSLEHIRFLEENGTLSKGWKVYTYKQGIRISLRTMESTPFRYLLSGKYQVIKVNDRIVYKNEGPETSRLEVRLLKEGTCLEYGWNRLCMSWYWDPSDEVFDFFCTHYRTLPRWTFHDDEGAVEKAILWAFCFSPSLENNEVFLREGFTKAWEEGNYPVALNYLTRYVKILSSFYYQIQNRRKF
jgi:hypothetical protein